MKKIVISLMALALAVCTAAAGDFVRPDFLKEGDKVAIISPSYYLEEAQIERACEVLRGWGLVPVRGANVGRNVGFVLAGTVDERKADLKWAFESPDIKAVFCTRGGYGAVQLLDSATVACCAAHPKWFIGFSDATILISALSTGGVMSVHGNMCNDICLSDTKPMPDNDALKDLLFGKLPEYKLPAHECNRTGTAVGRLVGGNMITFQMLSGTPYDSSVLDGTILFIEEVGESLKSIDRMINAMMLQKKFSGVRGIILGRFSDTNSNYPAQSAERIISDYAAALGIPVCCGFPAGHSGINMPLVMGDTVRLDVTSEGASVRFE